MSAILISNVIFNQNCAFRWQIRILKYGFVISCSQSDEFLDRSTYSLEDNIPVTVSISRGGEEYYYPENSYI